MGDASGEPLNQVTSEYVWSKDLRCVPVFVASLLRKLQHVPAAMHASGRKGK
jgi:hypothetical protein